MPTPKPHKWVYAELPSIPPTEGPRPAQRCARCGLVRVLLPDKQHWYYEPTLAEWMKPVNDYDPPSVIVSVFTEPPCVPQEAPAKPNVGP